MKTQSNMFEKLKKMQEAIENAQQQLELQEFIGKAGDVEIVLQGTKQVVDVVISQIHSKAILQESVLLAFNAALKKLERKSKELMQKASGYLIEF
ncbi:YbaB/EbfC family nucleoid-associated protein ['Elaeagnus angustifolia' witches'-broom phytoplasma]|uniref:Nucleoid-associated protein KEC49_01490 n=1 Tax='Elaeagnus angustifolia' witches'-broom phytoplasma TaxID=1538355 RepID=A0ABS5V919_9MOLU|nr:YbaB/EbfC family nucleoid-associated protein ['Elaeagnus angustifolia' witches'-broom phytoplasma]MCX2955749.1 YbaB/EbfC family nucleoid-associated protein [Candidatus Phytoplasma australiense]